MTRLHSADVESLRASCLPLPLTAAPATSCEHFKSPHGQGNPLARRWDHHFSTKSRNFQGLVLKKSSSPVGPRKIISLGTGRPSADYYPWQSLIFHGVLAVPLASKATTDGLGHLVHTLSKRDSLYNLSLGWNYGHAAGSPHLLWLIMEHVKLVHNPPYRDWGTFLLCGVTAALEVAFRIFCNHGNSVLAEQWMYPGTLESAVLNGVRVHGVEIDVDGLRPDHLEMILSSWDILLQGPRPRVLYTIPTGQNPMGYSLPAERRTAIYAIAGNYNLIIIEDDPYYFLRLGPYISDNTATTRTGEQEQPLNAADPSYLSLDISGRVVRLDLTSKILAPGLYMGWLTALA